MKAIFQKRGAFFSASYYQQPQINSFANPLSYQGFESFKSKPILTKRLGRGQKENWTWTLDRQDSVICAISGTFMGMNVVYFTLGESIADIEIRTQLLRIPEVLSDLRQAQDMIPGIDLLSMMGSQELFLQQPKEFRLKLAQLLQEALFKRWKLSQVKYDQIVERRKFSDSTTWRRALKEMLHQTPEFHIYVFGPGFDDLEYEISKLKFKKPPQIFLHEMISEDPMLDWFWPSIMQNAKLSA